MYTFPVDQHASDEIYNFESLQQTTIIQSQRLISFVQIFFLLHSMWRCLYPRLSLLIYYSPHPRRPRELNLPSQDEMTAIEHRELLRMNGFEIQVDEEADVGRRVHLIAQPVSKGTTFGVEGELLHLLDSSILLIELSDVDLEELLDLVKNIAPGQMIRPSKTRRMFASRACRMSVMIGTALTTNQMTTVSPPFHRGVREGVLMGESRFCDIWERWINLGLVLMGVRRCDGYVFVSSPSLICADNRCSSLDSTERKRMIDDLISFISSPTWSTRTARRSRLA